MVNIKIDTGANVPKVSEIIAKLWEQERKEMLGRCVPVPIDDETRYKMQWGNGNIGNKPLATAKWNEQSTKGMKERLEKAVKDILGGEG